MSSALHSYSDQELFSLLRQSDEGAFTELYNRYWEKLLFIAGIKLRDLAIAEELVQDIFFDLWQRRYELEISGEPSHYLAVCMKHKVINAQAKIKRALDYQAYSGKLLKEADNSTEHWLSFEELKGQLASLVAGLPERCRITYQLSREAGLSQKQIARKLQVSEKAVEGNLSRALKALRSGLAHFHCWIVFWL
ncbi:MAG TPA: sigma-70 family RNA polymerase sigma factor [Puia sp.]